MQALIYGLAFPVVTLLIRKSYKKEQTISKREWLVRYALYALTELLFVSIVMFFLCDEGTSFAAKMDASPAFVLKFVAVETLAALLVALAEWMYVTGKFAIRVEWQGFENTVLGKVMTRFLMPAGIYLAAIAVVVLNVSLMFDNVLWGDECFSANTAQKSMGGILQVMYFWDNHPPLHYYWTKLFGELLGHTGPVYHLAALTPFLIGIVMALTFLRKRFGNIPAAFFIIVTGLAAPCVQYNLEIRMYSLAFIGVAACFYSAYRVLAGGKLAWFTMVFWALVGAYSHYYALMTVGIMIFITGVAASVRYKGKTWIKGLLALLAFIAGYAPWLSYLFTATENVSNNWWMTEVLALRDGMRMILMGEEFEKIVGLLVVVFLTAILLTESSFFCIRKVAERTELTIHRPTLHRWSNEAYGVAVGALTIVGTLIAAYILCIFVGPVLNQRYLYPLSAVTALLLVMGGSGSLALVQELAKKTDKEWLVRLTKTVLVLAMAALVVIGIGNYRANRAMVKEEQRVTEQVLALVGEVPEDTALISNNVKHLAWTVLYYYYPDRDIVTGRCSEEGMEYDKFWYYTPEDIPESEMKEMQDAGYRVTSYGHQQIAVYPFELYYLESVK